MVAGGEAVISGMQPVIPSTGQVTGQVGGQVMLFCCTPRKAGEIAIVSFTWLVSTVYCWTSTEFIPHFKIGKCVRFREKDLYDWVENRYHKSRFSMKLPVPDL